jgi:hypothetical protein
MSKLKLKLREQVLQQLDNIKIDVQEIKNQIDLGNPSNEAIMIDFTFDSLNNNRVYSRVDSLQDEIRTLKMLLNLLK